MIVVYIPKSHIFFVVCMSSSGVVQHQGFGSNILIFRELFAT